MFLTIEHLEIDCGGLLSINEIDGLSPLLSPTDEHEYYV